MEDDSSPNPNRPGRRHGNALPFLVIKSLEFVLRVGCKIKALPFTWNPASPDLKLRSPALRSEKWRSWVFTSFDVSIVFSVSAAYVLGTSFADSSHSVSLWCLCVAWYGLGAMVTAIEVAGVETASWVN